jgi:Resolvase, N terminal domain
MTRSFPASRPVRSLAWQGDDLVDIAAGWRRWRADGGEEHGRVTYAFLFDRALVSPSGRFQVLYAERGTKGLVLEHGTILREINRSFYCANAYDYPVALGRLPDGREILAHCPEDYNVLEIEELESGRRLTTGPRRAVDVFHSRLAVSPDGRSLLSAGWLWHPVGTVEVYDPVAALDDPTVLDQHGALREQIDADVEAACWLDSDRLLVSGHPDEEPLDGDDAGLLAAGELGVWPITRQAWTHRRRIDFRVGTLLGCQSRALATYGHPKLIDPATQRCWPSGLSWRPAPRRPAIAPSRRRSWPSTPTGLAQRSPSPAPSSSSTSQASPAPPRQHPFRNVVLFRRHLVDTRQHSRRARRRLRSLQEQLDTTTPGGRLVFHIFAALAEFERDLIRECTTAGLAAARARGRKGGRPTVMTPAKIAAARQLYDSRQYTVAAIAKELGVFGASIDATCLPPRPPPATSTGRQGSEHVTTNDTTATGQR